MGSTPCGFLEHAPDRSSLLGQAAEPEEPSVVGPAAALSAAEAKLALKGRLGGNA